MLDTLLLWCSERVEGTLSSFRATYEWLARHNTAERTLSWTLAAYNLQVLGHVEIDWEADRWAVAPSVITTLADSGGHALLVGARPSWLMTRLESLDRDRDPALQVIAQSVVCEPPIPQEGGPAAQLLTLGKGADVLEVCTRLGIHYEQRVADRLLRLLPDLNALLAAGRAPSAPGGFLPARRVGSTNRVWEECGDDAAPGAYEYEGYGAPRYFFRYDAQHIYEVERRVAIYAELRRTRRHVLWWDAETQSLLAPARMQLPLLHGRCAVLRSGLLPEFRGSVTVGPKGARLDAMVRYRNIPEDFAMSLAASLGQDLILHRT